MSGHLLQSFLLIVFLFFKSFFGQLDRQLSFYKVSLVSNEWVLQVISESRPFNSTIGDSFTINTTRGYVPTLPVNAIPDQLV